MTEPLHNSAESKESPSAQTSAAVVSPEGLTLNGQLFTSKVPLADYAGVLGAPSRTLDGNQPAPVGHRNNQFHLFEELGIYLTEHHATRLIESVNFVLDPVECLFPMQRSFTGQLTVFGFAFAAGMTESQLPAMFERYLPGLHSIVEGKCWVGIRCTGRRMANRKRSRQRYVTSISVSFSAM